MRSQFNRVYRLTTGFIAFVSVGSLIPAVPLCGQWLPAGATSGPIYYNGGYVGIGTPSPGTTLDVMGIIRANNYFGFATVADTGYEWYTGAFGSGYGGAWSLVHRKISDGTFTVPLFAMPGGNVGIGTTSPQHLLHVAGTIGAEGIIVSATGADYVFDSGYRLAPLSEVADYIKDHHHLPEIPSAAEAEAKGVDLGEMQSKLLAKLEELTLHMIAEHERNNRLERQNMDLKKENRKIRQTLAALDAKASK